MWIAVGVIAVAIVAAYIALAQNTSSGTSTYTSTAPAGRWAGGAPYWRGGAPYGPCPASSAYPSRPSGWRGRWVGNAAAYPPTAENLSISMSSSQIALQLSLVGITRGSNAAAQIVAGSGSVEVGGQSYKVVSAYGVAGNGFFMLRLYTGNALMAITYFNGVYRAVIQPLGTTQITIYYGNATAQINP